MAFDTAPERTEEATPKRREEAREQGQVAFSNDLTTGLSLLIGLGTLAAVVPGGARVVVVKGAAHNFAGHLDELARCVAAAVPDEMRPAGRMTPPVGDDPAGVIS